MNIPQPYTELIEALITLGSYFAVATLITAPFLTIFSIGVIAGREWQRYTDFRDKDRKD